MTTYEPGDVVVVPFPFSDLPVAKPRPALVVSAASANKRGLTVLAMITTARDHEAAQDVVIQNGDQAGLRAASVVRAKVFSLDNRLISRRIGRLSDDDRLAARKGLADLFAL